VAFCFTETSMTRFLLFSSICIYWHLAVRLHIIEDNFFSFWLLNVSVISVFSHGVCI